jgi:hypothetical protein
MSRATSRKNIKILAKPPNAVEEDDGPKKARRRVKGMRRRKQKRMRRNIYQLGMVGLRKILYIRRS